MASLYGLSSSFILRKGKLTSLKSSGDFVKLTKLSSTTPCGSMPGIARYLFLICYKEIACKLTDYHREEEQFVQHLEVMLGEGVERPGWDVEARFTPANLQIYFENKSQELVKVSLLPFVFISHC